MDFSDSNGREKLQTKKQLQKDEGEKTLEEKETKNKFWKGVLVGASVTAFADLQWLDLVTGIWIIGRRTSRAEMHRRPERMPTSWI